jgi:hypothetical protein
MAGIRCKNGTKKKGTPVSRTFHRGFGGTSSAG